MSAYAIHDKKKVYLVVSKDMRIMGIFNNPTTANEHAEVDDIVMKRVVHEHTPHHKGFVL